MKKIFMLIIVLLFLNNCATLPKLNTPSGRPEISIKNTTKKEVKELLVNNFLPQGFQIKNNTEYNIVFAKKLSNSLSARVFYGSKYDGVPESRVDFSMAESYGEIKLFASCFIITNPNSSFERSEDITLQEGSNLMKILNNIKYSAEISNKGRIGIVVDTSALILKVAPNSPAELSGLKINDKIIKVDNQDIVINDIYKLLDQLVGEPSTKVTLTILREEEIKTFVVERKILK